MTESELNEIRTAINAAKQYSEDNPNGRYERLLIAVLPLLRNIEVAYLAHFDEMPMVDKTDKHHYRMHFIGGIALSIARAINGTKKETETILGFPVVVDPNMKSGEIKFGTYDDYIPFKPQEGE